MLDGADGEARDVDTESELLKTDEGADVGELSETTWG